MGLVWAVHDDESFEQETHRLASELAMGRKACRNQKGYNQALLRDFDTQLALEAETQRLAIAKIMSRRERFLEKRPAKFKGNDDGFRS